MTIITFANSKTLHVPFFNERSATQWTDILHCCLSLGLSAAVFIVNHVQSSTLRVHHLLSSPCTGWPQSRRKKLRVFQAFPEP